VYGALGRVYGDPSRSDTLVLDLPRTMVAGYGGELLTALVTAGAFAAFLSTSSGLSIAVSGVIGQDVIGRFTPSGVAAFRLAAVVAIVVPCALSVAVPNVGIARVVGLAFAVAASTFAPLLLLGIWWRGLTAAGALTGMLVGFAGSGTGVGYALANAEPAGWAGALLGQPAAWSVPLAFAVMVGVSRLNAGSVPDHAQRFMVRLHTPEALSLNRGLDGGPDRTPLG
jgi:cation/acetate symporter